MTQPVAKSDSPPNPVGCMVGLFFVALLLLGVEHGCSEPDYVHVNISDKWTSEFLGSRQYRIRFRPQGPKQSEHEWVVPRDVYEDAEVGSSMSLEVRCGGITGWCRQP